MKIQKVIAGLVLVMGMSAVGAQAQSGSFSDEVKTMQPDLVKFARICSFNALRTLARRADKNDSAATAFMARKEECGELAENLTYAFFGDDSGEDDGGEFDGEGAPLTAAAIKRKSTSTEAGTSTPTF
jgi:hypothetical protein